MSNVVFAVPFAMEATLRFVRAAAGLSGLRLAVVSQEAPDRLGRALLGQLATFQRVGNALDADQLADSVRAAAHALGGRVDALVGILEPLQESLAVVRERLGIPGMGIDAAHNFRDKARMKKVLRAHDLPCARHHLADSVAGAMAFAADCGFPLVVKPPAGAGAKNTVRVDDATALRDYLRTLPPSPAHRVLLEEFITGREFSFDTISLGGRHLFHSISSYSPTPLEVMQNPWIQWCVMLPRDIGGPEFAPIREAGPRALDALGMQTGMTHMEWFQRDDGSIAISEVAARPPGAQFTSLISYAHDHDFYRAWAELVAQHRFAPPERRYAVGAAFLRGQGSGRVVAIHGVNEAQREFGELVVEAKLPVPGQAQAGSYEGEGFVIVRHPETAVVENALRRLVTMLRVELG